MAAVCYISHYYQLPKWGRWCSQLGVFNQPWSSVSPATSLFFCICVHYIIELYHTTFFFLIFSLFPPTVCCRTGCQRDLEAGLQHNSSQGSLVLSPEHGHLRQRQQAQLPGDQHARPGAAHQLPHRRLDAGLHPELSHVAGQRPHARDARQRHHENLGRHHLLTPDQGVLIAAPHAVGMTENVGFFFLLLLLLFPSGPHCASKAKLPNVFYRGFVPGPWIPLYFPFKRTKKKKRRPIIGEQRCRDFTSCIYICLGLWCETSSSSHVGDSLAHRVRNSMFWGCIQPSTHINHPCVAGSELFLLTICKHCSTSPANEWNPTRLLLSNFNMALHNL